MLMIVGCEDDIDYDIIPPGYVPQTIRPLDETENQNRLEKCSTPPPASKNYDRNETWWIGRLTFGNNDNGNFRYEAALISPRHAIISSQILKKFKNWFERVPTGSGVDCSFDSPEMVDFFNDKRQPCTKDKTDGIIIVEFEKDIDIPYVCIPDYKYYNSIDKTEAIFSVKALPKKSSRGKDEYAYEAQDGMIERCDDRFCWSPDNQTQKYDEFDDKKGVSMPFLTKDNRQLLFGFGFKYDNKANKFAVTDLGDFLEGLCEHVGICPRKPTTPGIPTTTTARTARTTTRRVPSTTDYVPEFLYDEEARDFEEPYFKRNRTRKEGNRREWKITVVFVILVFLVLE
ncbi:unnamed protein product [Caenorhabditis nigoni]